MNRKGFTLIELLIVLAIIGIVLACAIPALYNVFKGKDAAVTDPLQAAYPIAASADWDDDLRKNLKVVCLDGFLYYYSREGSSALNKYGDESRAIFAPKFDQDRLPMRCPQEAPAKKAEKEKQ